MRTKYCTESGCCYLARESGRCIDHSKLRRGRAVSPTLYYTPEQRTKLRAMRKAYNAAWLVGDANKAQAAECGFVDILKELKVGNKKALDMDIFEKVIEAIQTAFVIPNPDKLFHATREREFSRPRTYAMLALVELCPDATYVEIGRAFGMVSGAVVVNQSVVGRNQGRLPWFEQSKLDQIIETVRNQSS